VYVGVSADGRRSPVRYVTEYSFVPNFWRFGKLYISETLGPTEPEEQRLHFSEHPTAAIFDFQNGDYFFLKSGHISASNHTRHMILVSTHTKTPLTATFVEH